MRADALADTQSETQSPTGLIVLEGQDKVRPWLDVEGLVWAGAKPGLTGDVLVLALHLREPHGYGELRVGRFVVATGAIFPVQIDGAEVIARAPWGSTLEVFGGAPVVPRFGRAPTTGSPACVSRSTSRARSRSVSLTCSGARTETSRTRRSGPISRLRPYAGWTSRPRAPTT